jgi:hypothetical protein
MLGGWRMTEPHQVRAELADLCVVPAGEYRLAGGLAVPARTWLRPVPELMMWQAGPPGRRAARRRKRRGTSGAGAASRALGIIMCAGPGWMKRRVASLVLLWPFLVASMLTVR